MSQASSTQRQELSHKYLPLAHKIAGRLGRRYNWVPREDLGSYAFLGLSRAAEVYCSDRGVPFANFAMFKGTYYAVDEMRKDGVLRRKDSPGKQVKPLLPDVVDPRCETARRRMEIRDQTSALVRHLAPRDQRLLMLYYGKGMTFREIAEVFDISESAVCMRHKALLRRLRRLAERSEVA